MATPIGANVVTSIARRHIMPQITDNVYGSNPVFFRFNKSNRKMIQGGTHIEVPLLYKRFTAGGPYSGYDVLTVTPQDTIKSAAVDWAQYYTHVTIDGLTLIKTDQPEAIANIISLLHQQAEMEMAENLAVGLWSNGSTNPKDMVGLEAIVDDGTVAATYAGLTRASNTWWNAQVDAATAALTETALNTFFHRCSQGGKHPTLIVSRQEQYNRMWVLGNTKFNYTSNMPGMYDQQLMSAGFSNILFNGTPWVVDPHVFNGPNASNSAIVFLTEDFLSLVVSPRADFYLEDFQTPHDQDAMVSKLLFAGTVISMNNQTQGKMTAVAA